MPIDRNSAIRYAFEFSVNFLGEQAKSAIIDDLRYDGVFLNDPELTLAKLSKGIRKVLGGEAANLIIERVLVQLDELHTLQIRRQLS